MKQLLVAGLLLAAIHGQTASSRPSPSRPLPEFAYTQGWLGADDAYSVPIGPDTSVWLFGDTFVGTKETKLRSQYKEMVRNSIGISVCKPDATCTTNYYWQKPDSDKPRSFFDTGTDELWYWPMDGFLRGRTLYVPQLAVRNKPNATPQDVFGFEIVGTKLAIVDDVSIPPEKWHISVRDLTEARLWAGTSLLADGKYVIWYTHVNGGEGQGYMTAMRVPQDKMANPSSAWEYLRKDGQWASGLAGEDAMHVIDQPISEMSVRYHPSIKKWLALSTGPEFPSTRAVVRIADSPVGPWSKPRTIYEFPEMKSSNPGYDKDTFCYAVKEHTEFTTAKIAMTYVCNSMVVKKAVANMDIYRPRVVILDLPQ